MTPIILKSRTIGPDAPLFVIAEAGVNHNGDLGLAFELVDVAAAAGADAVKFQSFVSENLITSSAPKAPYHTETTGPDEQQTWYELLKTQELSPKDHEAIQRRCAEKGILFLSTPYDNESVDLLDRLEVPLFKIASTDANNIPFLEYVTAKGRPMILSTAMCEMDEVRASVDAIRRSGVSELLVMQCTGSYPAPTAEANLRAMASIADACGVLVGYSDHTVGNEAAIAATALGARAYEKHFTLDRQLPGPDHRASLEPDELVGLIKAIRAVESAMGDGIKKVMPCEEINRTRLRKSILAARDLNTGAVLALQDLAFKRAGGQGLSPDHYRNLLGKTLTNPVAADHPITLDDVT